MVFALLATEDLQIHFFFESLIFNFAFWRNVVSKSNAASSSSPRAALPRQPAIQPASGVLPVRPSVRPSVRPPARSWQAWLPFACCCCCCPSLHIYIFFPPWICQIIVAEFSQGCQFFTLHLPKLSLTASVITTSVCLCTVSIGP